MKRLAFLGGCSLLASTSASAQPFSDPTLAPGTIITAVHGLELRARIDAIRTPLGLAPVSWDGAVAPQVTVITAQHWIDLRSALNQAYVAAGCFIWPPRDW